MGLWHTLFLFFSSSIYVPCRCAVSCRVVVVCFQCASTKENEKDTLVQLIDSLADIILIVTAPHRVEAGEPVHYVLVTGEYFAQ